MMATEQPLILNDLKQSVRVRAPNWLFSCRQKADRREDEAQYMRFKEALLLGTWVLIPGMSPVLK